MKLIIDIGNSNIVIGIYNGKWQHIWRLPTLKNASVIEYGLKINTLLWEAGINPDDFEYKLFSSVVPELKDTFKVVLQKLDDNPVYILDKNVFHKFDINIPSPDEIGTDLVANILAVNKLYNEDIIIVDFGTALTFTAVTKTGDIQGINIAPGLKTAINALTEKTAQLDPVPLEFPDNPLGQNTKTAIQNGILWGYTGLVNFMIQKIKQKLGKHYKVVVTGGLLSVLLAELQPVDYVNKDLTLHGLLQAGEILKNKP